MKDAKLEELRETWVQDVDSCGSPNLMINQIDVQSQDAGGGWYVVIKTERWSLNDEADIDAFAACLKALLAREPKGTR
jgi:hypothetical protein